MMRLPHPDYVKQGQPYWRKVGGRREHVTRSGKTIMLDVWCAFCAEPDCGAWFECTTAEEQAPEVRRCPEHRKPLVRVAPRAKRVAVQRGCS